MPMNASASRKFWQGLPDHERQRYTEVLLLAHALRLGVRCEMVGGREFAITIQYGLGSARMWLDIFGISPEPPA